MVKKVIVRLVFLLLISLIIPTAAYAYLDPGTGSMLVQAIIAMIAAVGVSYGVFKGKIKELFNRFFRRQRSDDEG